MGRLDKHPTLYTCYHHRKHCVGDFLEEVIRSGKMEGDGGPQKRDFHTGSSQRKA